LFESLQEAEKIFSDFMPALRNNHHNFVPAIDMYEDKDNVIVETQLAGIQPENVQISIDNDTLSIKGEGEKRSEIDEKNYYRQEIRRGSFYRSIQLPAHVLSDQTKAMTADGVLKIIIPKAPETKPRTIKITTKNNK
jgi:HSP20 family protein